MEDIDLSSVPPSIRTVAERAQKAAWDFEWIKPREELTLVIWIPNGRDKRRTVVNESRATRLLAVPFEQFRLLGDYLAINNSSTNYFEVLVRSPGRALAVGGLSITDIPGFEVIESSSDTDSDASEEGTDASEESIEVSAGDTPVRPKQGRLRIEDERSARSIEISEMSDEFFALVRSPAIRVMKHNRQKQLTLKIRGVEAPRHDDAVRRLEDISLSVLFELDIRYGVLLEVARYEVLPFFARYAAEPVARPPAFPRLRYPSEAISLYSYGRSARGMPLLQFLAYYQVLEFFFPMYSRQRVLRRLRQEINDPRFDSTDDADLARLLALTTMGGRSGYGSEREQLKATVEGCVDETTLRSFFRATPEWFGTLADKRTIKNVPVVDEANNRIPLTDQVVERIYALRNRVVHAKADGGDTAIDLLLPGSSEAAALTADITVLQFLAQKAIVAGGSPLS